MAVTITPREPTAVTPSAEEIKNKRLSEENLKIAVEALTRDGIVVVEDAIPIEDLDHLNAKMIQDSALLQSRGEDSPFNYNKGNLQQDAPPWAEYFHPSIFCSCVAPFFSPP
ncbi:hypothetical protein ONZ43_g62 [Nemania bipapillata]|uniref:Uncharacterized protein n=1 Tax=Nemania bipapillata TaxID=110536 RepID=A0ACC2J9U3_9PEZI|nr:hypothetical protein ONZ43_g62 [Nemania bipapillata]